MRRRVVAADDTADLRTNRKRSLAVARIRLRRYFQRLGRRKDAAFWIKCQWDQLISGHMTCVSQALGAEL